VNLDPLLPWLLSVALLTMRLTVALGLSPAFTAYRVPASVRVALIVAIAALTCAYRGALPAAAGWVANPTLLVMPVLAEVFVGALLGLAVQVVLAALALAGRLMDVQTGFAIGSIFDPVTGASSNVLGSIAGLLGISLFIIGDAHLQLVRLLSESIDVFPLGQFPPLSEPLLPLLAAGSMFALGLALAAPLVAALLLTDLAMGVASRNMPQINVLLLAMPVKVIVGYLVLTLSVRGWGPLVSRGFAHMTDVLGLT
jgi:flagellar biosynthetic protein FliR